MHLEEENWAQRTQTLTKRSPRPLTTSSSISVCSLRALAPDWRSGERRWERRRGCGGTRRGRRPYLVVNRHLRVGVALVEGFDLADVLLLRELHHPEHDRHLCWKLGELQLATRRWARGAEEGGKRESWQKVARGKVQ